MADAQEWMERYAAEMGTKARSADQLLKFIKNRGGNIAYSAINKSGIVFDDAPVKGSADSRGSDASKAPGPPKIPVTKQGSSRSDGSESEEEDDADELPEEPLPVKQSMRGRTSVSAEAYGEWNKKQDFTPPVYPKTPEVEGRIRQVLGRSFLFNALEDQDLTTVILAMKERPTTKDETIIEAGDAGDSMFVIEEGRIECYKNIDGTRTMVKACSAGDIVGELALLYNAPRAADVVSLSAGLLWELDRQTFNRIVKDAAANKRNTYTDFLKKCQIFEGMDAYGVMTICDALKMEKIEKEGVQIIKQGDPGDKFYIVLEGHFVAKKVEGGGPENVVMEHKVGDYFGELALLKDAPRAASVYSASATGKLISLDRATFKRLLGPAEKFLTKEAKERYGLA